MSEAITLPRKKHSHRCKLCREGTYCYKTQCMQPQRIEACSACRWKIDYLAKQAAKEVA